MERYQPARVNPPGAQTAYSNYATALAGLIVENVSGVPFIDYIRQEILEPLGMEHSSFAEPLPEPLSNTWPRATPSRRGASSRSRSRSSAISHPPGHCRQPRTDMVRFGQAILNGGELDGQRIIGADTLEADAEPCLLAR